MYMGAWVCPKLSMSCDSAHTMHTLPVNFSQPHNHASLAHQKFNHVNFPYLSHDWFGEKSRVFSVVAPLQQGKASSLAWDKILSSASKECNNTSNNKVVKSILAWLNIIAWRLNEPFFECPLVSNWDFVHHVWIRDLPADLIRKSKSKCLHVYM